ncbi:hypothetical protein ACFOZ0_11200 [Streptomyces yaanensis]|uniref:Secreted protein n=1 Tax=Streptomyces yaanensis TaxID=1142239 RepID=A0ABV7SA90_9ACTN|nr:hypothetical protein [Streptomyces sp. CGMCC 4.7035]WNB96901.1 hypothetical protein Q2K21_01780 [Streptomyces sp. CGMCC 4.7035]
MTSATHLTRRQARTALAAAGLTAALVLTGCGSDSGDDDSSAPSAPASTPTANTGGGSGTPNAKAAGKLEGSWLATTGGKAVAFVVTGNQAALFTTGGTVCSGTAGEEAGMQMIRLKCTDGNKDRRTGMVDSVNSTTMKVTWSGGSVGKETYTKSEGGKLPSGLPTASLGS